MYRNRVSNLLQDTRNEGYWLFEAGAAQMKKNILIIVAGLIWCVGKEGYV